MAKHRKNPDRPEPAYEVGYQKPPTEHKFKPGHKGFGPRRQKRLDINEKINEALMRKATLTINGEEQRMTLFDAMVHRLVTQVVGNPAKFLKPNMPLILGALAAQAASVGIDENGADMTAAFRAKIETWPKDISFGRKASWKTRTASCRRSQTISRLNPATNCAAAGTRFRRRRFFHPQGATTALPFCDLKSRC